MAGVLVFGETAGGQLTPASLEAAGAGAALAHAWGETLQGALIGHEIAAACEQFRRAVATLHVIEAEQYRAYLADERVAAAAAIIKACSPSVVLFTHTLATREWVPQLAARLDTGLVMDCTAVSVDSMEGRDLVATKPVYGGGVLGAFLIRGPHRMATVGSGAFQPRAPGVPRNIVRVDAPAPALVRVVFLDGKTAAPSGGPSLKDARVVVAGGRGLGAAANWRYIEETARLLGAAVGCSRPVADSGWVPTALQVGLSGTCVAPDLYIRAVETAALVDGSEKIHKFCG